MLRGSTERASMSKRSFGSVVRRRRRDGSLLPNYSAAWTDEEGRRHLRSVGPSKASAEQFLEDLRARKEAGAVATSAGLTGPGARSFGALQGPILAAWRTRLAAGTLRNRPSTLARWAALLGPRPAALLAPADVQAAVNVRAGKGLKASTLRNEVAVLSAAFRAAEKDLGVPFPAGNPCRGLTLPRVQLRPRPYLRGDQIARLLAACAPEIRGSVTVLADAGLRPAELLRLTWAEVDLELRVLRLDRTKTYTTRAIPLTDRALDALRAAREAREGAPAPEARVFTVAEKTLRAGFREAVAAAGMPRSVVPYTLRHAFACGLLVEGAPPAVVRDLLGHANLATTDIYLRSLPGDAARAAVDSLAKSRAPIDVEGGGVLLHGTNT